MNIRKCFILVLLLVVFVQQCYAGKKNNEKKELKEKEAKDEDKKKKISEPKKKKETEPKDKNEKDPIEKKEKYKNKDKENKDKKNKEKGDKGNKESKQDKKKGGLLTSATAEDKEYWFYENIQRSWKESDNPLHNQLIINITKELTDFVAQFGEISLVGLDDNVLDIMKGIYELQEKYIDLGIPLAYVVVEMGLSFETKMFPISTVFGAIVDTKDGQDIPPILASTKGCTLENCMETKHQWLVNEAQKLNSVDLATPSPSSIIEDLQDSFLSNFAQLTLTFSKKETQEIMCARSESISTTKLTVAAELALIENETREFIKEPGRFSKEVAEKRLVKSFNRVRGHMLLKLVEGLCGESFTDNIDID